MKTLDFDKFAEANPEILLGKYVVGFRNAVIITKYISYITYKDIDNWWVSSDVI